MIYFSTFISGCQEIVKAALERQLKGVKTKLLLDGLVVYQSDEPQNKIKNLRFLNNSFILLHQFGNLPADPIREMAKQVISRQELVKDLLFLPKDARSFRVIASKENQLVSFTGNELLDLEKLFSRLTSLKVDRTSPDTEIWFLSRSEKIGFLGIRLTRPKLSNDLEKGELRPELAHILCLVSEPESQDIFLDPFSGVGAIPLERTTFPYRKIVAVEKDEKLFKKLKNRAQKIKEKLMVYRGDALNLSFLADQSIDKIVTDPPWGFFSGGENLEEFYTKMLQEFVRVIKKNGLIVVLMGQKEIFEEVMAKTADLTLIQRYDILVSGKKAAIYKIRKN